MALNLLASNKHHIHNHFYFFFFLSGFIAVRYIAKRQIIEGTFRTAVAS